MDSRVSRRVLTVALTLVAVLVVGTIGFFAAQSPGYASTSVQAQQRAVWVTSGKDLMLGLLNPQTREVESPIVLDSQDTELLQEHDSVVLLDHSLHTMRAVNTTTAVMSGKMSVPDHAVAALSGSTVAVADQQTGGIWTMPISGLGNSDLISQKPNAQSAPGVVVTVAGDTVTAVAPGSDALTTLSGGGDDAGDSSNSGDNTAADGTAAAGADDANGAAGADDQGSTTAANSPKLPGGPLPKASADDPTPVSITSVGATPVVLDAAAHRLIVGAATGPASFDLPTDAAHPVLQQAGPASDSVLIGTDAALLKVNLSSGEVQAQVTPHPGRAAAPVLVAGCAHEAWAGGQAMYLSWCGAAPRLRQIAKVTDNSDLIFRVNESTVVLNDVTTGNSWVIDDTMILVNNWDQIRSDQNEPTNNESSADGAANRLTTARTDCTKGQVPPAPKDDSYGVRVGKPRVLSVLDNDGNSSCSVSVITQIDAPDGVAAIADNGQAIQVTPPQNAVAPIEIGYTVDDGADHQATAKVMVTPIAAAAKPIPPKMVRPSATSVTVGGTVTREVLSDWISPSGDDLFLTSATSSNPDDRISFSPDGNITVGDTGTAGVSKKTISFTVSDGTNAVPGRLTVQVVDEAKAHPVASPVYVWGIVDEQIHAAPLTSVMWPGSEDLILTKVAPQKASPGLSVTPDLQSGNVTIVAAKAGSYYLDYHVSAGDKQSAGVLRVDVREPPKEQTPPLAMTDVAYLPTGGETLVDLTRNDSDPAGGIVAVQHVDSAEDKGLVVQSIDMHLVRISARRPLPAGGIWLQYQVSAGGPSADGWLHVITVPRPAEPMSPTAAPIQVSVRAGDAVTIPIAAHAIDPGGDLVTPVPFPADAIGADQGLLFATDDSLRYMAPASGPVSKGKTLHTLYTVTNQAGKRASANLSITVVAAGDNAAPHTPPTAQARVFAGGTVDIPLPIDGIDPDGDWAIAAGIAEPPNSGTAAIAGTSSVRYTAFDQPGLDTFTYTVSDPFGGTATGTVDVLVVPLPKTSEPPVAPDLEVTVAPGKAIAVNVLDEVTDPGGLQVSFADPAYSLSGSQPGIEPVVRDGTIVVKAGPKPVTAAVQYNVKNEAQRTASGTLTVKVDPKAPKVPPTAKDALIVENMISPDKSSASVDLANWTANPGGVPEDLQAAVPEVSKGRLKITGKRTVSVALTERRQVLAYQVKNTDGLSAEAFLIVPSRTELNLAAPAKGQQQQQPKPEKKKEEPVKVAEVFTPKPLAEPLVVDAGTVATVKVAKYVGGEKKGRNVTLPADGANKASVGELSRVDADTLKWKVPADAEGKAQLNVTVTDGVAKPARAGIPATIRQPKPKAPKLQGADVQVEPGAATTPTALLPLVSYDADKKSNLKFALANASSSGITARLTGDQFTASAGASTKKGTKATFEVSVSDGISPPDPANFTVTVISSSKRLATVPDASVDALAGQPKSVNVLDGASNPFGPDQPLKLLDAASGSGYSVTFTGSGNVTVTPNPDYVGTLHLPLVVADASGDPDRNVQAQLIATVRGKPGTPGVPTKLQVGDSTATIQWNEPDDNGSPIAGYTVQANGFSQDCPSSPCTLKGLKNNTSYSFTVIARNEVGRSPASPGSAAIRPDVSPEAPGTPKLTLGDKQLASTWQTPANNGSPITGYEMQIVPAPGGAPGTVKVGPTVTSRDINGLENGTKYTVKVRALNASGSPSDWSTGASEVPAGKPGVPTNVTVSAAEKAGAAKRVDASWDAAAANGDAPHYTMTWKADDGTGGTVEVPAGKSSASIDPAKRGVKYTVTVSATNKADTSAQSAPVSVSPYTAPDQVTDLAAAATGNDGQVKLHWSAPADNGRPITTFFYTDGVNGWKDTGGAATDFSPPALTNGTTYHFQVRACTAEKKGSNCGQDSNASDASPYGGPGAPQNVKADPDAAQKQVVVSWAAADGNGRKIDHYTVSDGQKSQDVAAGTMTATFDGLANGKQYMFTVVAVTAEKSNNQSAGASDKATPYGEPGASTGLTVDRTGANNQVKFDWKEGNANGRPITSYDYTTDDGSTWRAVGNGGTQKVQSNGNTLKNGTVYTFQVRAHTGAPKRNVSKLSNSNTAEPYGPIGSPKIKATRSGNKVTFKWSWPSGGNGRTIDSKTVTIEGQTVAAGAGSWSKDVGYSHTAKGTAKFCVSGPTDCKSASDSITTPKKPANPTITVVKGKSAVGHRGGNGDICTNQSCRFIDIVIKDWPNVNITCQTSVSTYKEKHQGNGTIHTNSYFGFPRQKVSATCSGGKITESDSLTW